MSIDADNKSHESVVEDYLKDISDHMRFLVEIVRDSFNSDLELHDIEKLEDGEDGN